jgi:hypothetical protein
MSLPNGLNHRVCGVLGLAPAVNIDTGKEVPVISHLWRC